MSRSALVLVSALVASCASAPRAAAPSATAPDALRAVVDAPDRSGDDRALDVQRHPAELLAFFGVQRGQRVRNTVQRGPRVHRPL